MPILDRFSLKGKVALITGGAGLYGRQIAEGVAEAGATTFIASRNIEALEQFAAEHRARFYDLVALTYDQADERSILDLRDEVARRSGRLDVLVNNAVSRPMASGMKDTAESFAASMQVNATGLFTITRAFGDMMAERGSGSIINIGSIQGVVGPDPSIYRGTEMSGWVPDYFFHKGGMINLTRFIASYYGSRNIRCNCICPGGYRTDTMPEAFVRQYSERTMLGRLAGDDDLTGIVVFLASDASGYVTGTSIPVDGGYTAR
jgi:NAD(P)-dependent dehydrogenase (short-subunit alcohol dehydrogenase family)